MDLDTLAVLPPWEWPEDAGQRLLECLTDREADENARVIAAELSGDATVINDELVDALLSVVASSEESDNVRAQAAIALGPVLEIGDTDGFDDWLDSDSAPISEVTFERVRTALRGLYLDARVPKAVRRRILEASVRARDDWHENAIRAAYTSSEAEWRLTAVFAMRFVRGFDDEILESINDPDTQIQHEAICAAGNWELDAAWSQVAKHVNSASTTKSIRLAAMEAAATIRPAEAGILLIQVADESNDAEIIEVAEQAMQMADIASTDPFLEDEEIG
jgi:hypothetical protein